MLPTTMKALVTVGDGSFQLKEVAVPGPGADQILVKVVAAAQNPTDWKTLLLHTQPGNILGCDFAGTIVQIGTDVPAGLRKLGERVAGVVHGGIGPNGAYAEYVVADAALVIALPDDMTFENAAQLGVASLTTCQCLYQCLRLPTPLAPALVPDDILIWSGTSATGQYAVQFAKVAGLRVISTASPGNIDFVKSLGADEVFDYADSKTPKRIAAAAGGTLKYAVDCISEGMTPNQAVEFPFPFPQNSEHHENAKMYCKLISEVLSKHTIKPVPLRLYPNGLASVELGFEDMKAGKVHAEKITYRISDTPGLSE
ncbi:chaperonin 10-like protein [Mycena olivaceomarginata]|nr:chaperonin 10-like protein [Mycena olivaceomarginata]